jgi:alpha-galactosidase
MNFLSVLRTPDKINIQTDEATFPLQFAAEHWGYSDVEVHTPCDERGLRVVLAAPQSAIKWIHLRWNGEMLENARYWGDHWERSYADMEWRGLVPERVMPWYFLLHDGKATHGYGVQTGAASIAFWRADAQGISLWLDVRNGGSGVRLGERRLEAARVLCREGNDGESPFEAAQAFCRVLCEKPILPTQPVYGGNDCITPTATIRQIRFGAMRPSSLNSRLLAIIAPSW